MNLDEAERIDVRVAQTHGAGEDGIAFQQFLLATKTAAQFGLGLEQFTGVVPGRDSLVLTLVPALITALGVLLVALSPRLLRALGNRGGSADTTSTSPAPPVERDLPIGNG